MKNKTAQVFKIKNFEGRWFTCCNCGREIKHAYAFSTAPGAGIYGSECVWKVLNISPEKSKSLVKEAKARMKNIESLQKIGQLKETAARLGVTEDQAIATYLEYGHF